MLSIMRLREIKPTIAAVPDLIVSATRSGDEITIAATRLRTAVEIAMVVLIVIATVATFALAASVAAIKAVANAR